MSETKVNAPPVRLFWWNATPNFGDALSPLVVAALSGGAVVHSGPARCDLLALGSLVQVMARKFEAPRSGPRPIIWGAGLLHDCDRRFLGHVDIALLRGPLTAERLGIGAGGFGDPGLLADRLIDDPPAQTDRVALIPHHSMAEDPALMALVGAERALDLILPDTSPLDVLRRIAACRHVISASLHGLIAADAFGIPSTWLKPRGQSWFKYRDYAASVGRALHTPISAPDVPAFLRGLGDADELPYADGIARARADLLETFPAHLRAAPEVASAQKRA